MKLSSQTAILALMICGLFSEAHAKCGASEPAKQSAFDTIRDNPQLVTFYMLVRKAGLADKLKSGTSCTVFAPTDSAFRNMPREKLEALEKDKTALRLMLMSHIAEGRIYRSNLEKQRMLVSLTGETIDIRGKNDNLSANGVRLSASSVPASNGVIHLVDSVFANGARPLNVSVQR